MISVTKVAEWNPQAASVFADMAASGRLPVTWEGEPLTWLELTAMARRIFQGRPLACTIPQADLARLSISPEHGAIRPDAALGKLAGYIDGVIVYAGDRLMFWPVSIVPDPHVMRVRGVTLERGGA